MERSFCQPGELNQFIKSIDHLSSQFADDPRLGNDHPVHLELRQIEGSHGHEPAIPPGRRARDEFGRSRLVLPVRSTIRRHTNDLPIDERVAHGDRHLVYLVAAGRHRYAAHGARRPEVQREPGLGELIALVDPDFIRGSSLRPVNRPQRHDIVIIQPGSSNSSSNKEPH